MRPSGEVAVASDDWANKSELQLSERRNEMGRNGLSILELISLLLENANAPIAFENGVLNIFELHDAFRAGGGHHVIILQARSAHHLHLPFTVFQQNQWRSIHPLA